MDNISVIEADKIGSATNAAATRSFAPCDHSAPTARRGPATSWSCACSTDNATYNMLELPTGRLAKSESG